PRAEKALGNLAVGLANALSPALIVIGGSVAEHEPSHTLEPMRRAIADRAFKVAAAAVKIVPAALGRDVGMLGAVIYGRERVAGRDEWFRRERFSLYASLRGGEIDDEDRDQRVRPHRPSVPQGAHRAASRDRNRPSERSCGPADDR